MLLVITSLVLISLDERGSGIIDRIRSTAQDVVNPLQDLTNDAFSPATDFFDGLGRGNELEAENARLHRQIERLAAEQAAAARDRARYEAIAPIVDLPDLVDWDGVIANVTGDGVDVLRRTFMLDKGSDAGIGIDAPVVAGSAKGNALVGKVIAVSKGTATVQRIDDPEWGTGVQLVQDGVFGPTGIAQGQEGSTLLELRLLVDAAAVTIARNDLVVTTGGATSGYPTGLSVGRIVRGVTPETAVARNATLRPIVDLDSLTIVKVLQPPVRAQ